MSSGLTARRCALPSLLLLVVVGGACAGAVGPAKPPQQPRTPLDTLPSSMPLADYEGEVLYPWLWRQAYSSLGWTVDSRVRDTGPFIEGMSYGTHPAVRIVYSPEVTKWLDGGRVGEIDPGGMIIKVMYKPPAAIYNTVAESPWFQQHPDRYEALLGELVTGWTVLIKDPGGDTKDGWFWAGPGNAATLEQMLAESAGNVDDYQHTLTSGFGIGTCVRCHASAESENTFSSTSNFDPSESPLTFRVDNSWRSLEHLDSKDAKTYTTISDFLTDNDVPQAEAEALRHQLVLPQQQRPWSAADVPGLTAYVSAHSPKPPPVMAATARKQVDPAFAETFADLQHVVGEPQSAQEIRRFSFPFEFSDHVPPRSAIAKGGIDNPSEYVTSDNCYGCHGGLGGSPSGVTMFVQTGPDYGAGYNVSEYGEWRWSPMGLAGRDPIFHAQLETEMIILLQENGQLRDGQPATGAVRTTQQALTDTCLRCHGALGLRQKGIDQGGDILNPRFDVDFYYLEEPLTAEQATNPEFAPWPHEVNPPSELTRAEFYASHDYGELAREGISCTVCHHIAPPDPAAADSWVADHPSYFGPSPVWSDSFFYFLGKNTTGLYRRSPADELYGPFSDVLVKPMQHALGITPKVAPAMHHDTPFTSDSAMCGSCHTINLPNIGASTTPPEYPILTALEPNPHFQEISHSIEQATYLEWLNSSFGLGRHNQKGNKFQSCQDCHMPNRFETLDGSVTIAPLASQIASIQDSGYPTAEHQLPAADLGVPVRSDYRRHELVGLNAFVVEMFKQFPNILGVSGSDYMTGAQTGADLAIDSMLLSARQSRVATTSVDAVTIGEGTLAVDVTVTNKTGHRMPSGVTFRRAFVELLVIDEDDNVIWGSGQTNAAGVIVDNDGLPLPTELLDRKAKPSDRIALYQPNYQTIRSDEQVQIYEELITNASDVFTTSFIHRVHHIKDNRLLAEGAVDAETFAGQTESAGLGNQGDLLLEFMRSTEAEGASVVGGTDPNGAVFAPDPDFTASPNSGSDHLRYEIPLADIAGTPAAVKVTLYSQSLMPAWFHQRFSLANDAKAAGYDTPETDRLYYLASHLDLRETDLAKWKLTIHSDRRPVGPTE